MSVITNKITLTAEELSEKAWMFDVIQDLMTKPNKSRNLDFLIHFEDGKVTSYSYGPDFRKFAEVQENLDGTARGE